MRAVLEANHSVAGMEPAAREALIEGVLRRGSDRAFLAQAGACRERFAPAVRVMRETERSA